MKQLFLSFSFFRLFSLPILVVLSLLAVVSVHAQTIRYVKPDGSGNGTSWTTASADLQAIINASSAGDQVWVAAGTYKPGGNANTDPTISFSMKDDVAIYGGFAGTENTLSERPASIATAPSSSTLSGDIGAISTIYDNSTSVISNVNLSNTAVLDGFVITAGYSSYIPGAGMRNQASNPTLRNCQFTANVSGFVGGGMYNLGGSSPSLTNCSFIENRGGAIFSESGSTVALTRCTFSYNSTSGSPAVRGGTLIVVDCSFNNNNGIAGNLGSNGGALLIGTGSTVTNSLFVSNNGQGRGGAIFIAGNATITNCTFRGNLASGFGGIANPDGFGGAIYVESGSPVITNCSFSTNQAAARRAASGGAIYNYDGTPLFVNCSFGNNGRDDINSTGGAFYNEKNVSTLVNCIIWGNVPNNIVNGTGGSTVATYSDTQDNLPGTGNFSLDPLFVDGAGDNLRLRACSPAIDKGDNTANSTTIDLNNSPRLVRQIDLGPYEFQGTPQALVAITQQPASFSSIPAGGTLTASVTASGTISAYHWYKDGAPISGATSATLTVSNLNTSNAGRYYVVVTGTCNSVTSADLVLEINSGMYTLKAGRWDDASVWSMNRVPVGSDVVRIKHQVTVPGGYAAQAYQLSYDPGQTLQLGTGSKINLTQ
jgi:hypothetical protein